MSDGNGIFILGQVILFISIVVVCYSAWDLFSARLDIGRRLKGRSLAKAVEAAGKEFGLSLDDLSLKRYEKYLTPKDEKTFNAVRKSLIRAGYRKYSAVRVFYAFRIGMSIGFLLLGVLTLPLLMAQMPTYVSIVTLLLMLIMGYYAPSFWVERAYQYRTMQIRDSFADALDLLLVCIEAGHGFDQALNRVVRELGISNPVLSDELQVITRELRAGKERYRVLEDFADRTGVDDIKSFITVIKQADKFGVSIAQALRVYSGEMRDKRYMRAEEKANMMPIKLALGAIVFTVPPAILVMVGPSVIMIIQNLGALM